MKIIVLSLICVACIIGWLAINIALKAMLFYMKDKKYALPTKAELKKWCKYAARDTFGIS